MPYCDNIIAGGLVAALVDAALARIVALFRALGFIIHEIEWAAAVVELLGARWDGRRGWLSPRPSKAWALAQALRWAALAWCTSLQLAALVGQFVSMA
eukprot:10509782-Lingulodinium_polyedra.AAC.1